MKKQKQKKPKVSKVSKGKKTGLGKYAKWAVPGKASLADIYHIPA